MNKTNPNTSINYLPERQLNSGDKPTYHDESIGLTKREYLAAKMMQAQLIMLQNENALIAAQETARREGRSIEDKLAEMALLATDALIGALNGK